MVLPGDRIVSVAGANFGTPAFGHHARGLIEGFHGSPEGTTIVIQRARARRAGAHGSLFETLTTVEETVSQFRLLKGWGDAWRLFTDAA